MLRIIRACRGVGGGNREYILNTLSHLRQMGVSCPMLERLGGVVVSQTSGGSFILFLSSE